VELLELHLGQKKGKDTRINLKRKGYALMLLELVAVTEKGVLPGPDYTSLSSEDSSDSIN